MMNRYFPDISSHSSHFYIADYTRKTRSAKGVEISDTPFSDIHYCTVSNPRNIECWGVNFEKNQGVFKIANTGEQAKQCECLIASKNAKKKGWVCLVELKYCLEQNVVSNSKDAFNQLIACFDYLKDRDILDLKIHRVYFNISIPDHSNKQPFNNFSQDITIDLMKNKSIRLLGSNEIKVLNEGYLATA